MIFPEPTRLYARPRIALLPCSYRNTGAHSMGPVIPGTLRKFNNAVQDESKEVNSI